MRIVNLPATASKTRFQKPVRSENWNSLLRPLRTLLAGELSVGFIGQISCNGIVADGLSLFGRQLNQGADDSQSCSAFHDFRWVMVASLPDHFGSGRVLFLFGRFARYDCPLQFVLGADSVNAAATLNTLYNDMISKYQAKAKKADSTI